MPFIPINVAANTETSVIPKPPKGSIMVRILALSGTGAVIFKDGPNIINGPTGITPTFSLFSNMYPSGIPIQNDFRMVSSAAIGGFIIYDVV